MTEPPRYSDSNLDTGGDAGVRPPREATTGMPRWVKVSGIVVIVVVLLLVVLQLLGVGGEHGPSRHALSADVGSPSSSFSWTARGVQQL